MPDQLTEFDKNLPIEERLPWRKMNITDNDRDDYIDPFHESKREGNPRGALTWSTSPLHINLQRLVKQGFIPKGSDISDDGFDCIYYPPNISGFNNPEEARQKAEETWDVFLEDYNEEHLKFRDEEDEPKPMFDDHPSHFVLIGRRGRHQGPKDMSYYLCPFSVRNEKEGNEFDRDSVYLVHGLNADGSEKITHKEFVDMLTRDVIQSDPNPIYTYTIMILNVSWNKRQWLDKGT